jgi:FKBP-type peptidyl-prolyl cis-trans isomerase
MIIKNKFGIFFFLVAVVFIMYSCFKNDDEQRTLAIEMAEINEAILKLEQGGYNVDTTELGVFYILKKQGAGSYPQAGDTCYINYTGLFLNGTIFDASAYYEEDSIMNFIYKEQNFISGFNDGIALMNKGTSIELIVPSSLAYGAKGTLGIPPYSPLVFVVKMQNLKPKAE